jgi:hypothetical protein
VQKGKISVGLLDLSFLEQIALANKHKGRKPVAKKKVATKKRGANSTVDAEAYVKAYKAVAKKGGTLDDLATQLGMTKQNVQARKMNYQKAGVKFPKLSRSAGKKKIDAKALQAILDG